METPPESSPSAPLPDWEAFYASYRKPGYVLGYEITSKLGGGMFGLVFRARKQSIGKDYAIKFLQVEDGEVRRAVVAELEQLQYFAQIDHPNLVSIEDRGEVDGIPYFVMSFAGTETLASRLPADGRPPAGERRAELLQCFLQACRGVAALHERSLVHFDLKPANVFLKGNVARVGDYGLSKLVTHSRGSLSMGRGTPYYMAPEMLQRRGDARSDVYSLGVMLYEILCGKVPFTGESEWEVLRKHETEPPALPSHLSASERAILQRCLAKDPAARFQSVRDLLAAFGAPAGAGADAVAAPAPPVLPPPAAADLPPWPEPDAQCVPPLPPLPAPPTGPRHRGRQPSFVPRLLLGACLVFFASKWLLGAVLRPSEVQVRARYATQDEAPSALPLPPGLAPLEARVYAFVAKAQQDVRRAEQKRERVALVPLGPRLQRQVPDLPSYLELVDRLAEAPAFSAGHATKLASHGIPVFLAAVQRLQELDYGDGRCCRRACHLQRLLAQMVAMPGLCTGPPRGEPTRAEECRLRAMARAWGQFAQQFAADAASFDSLLAARTAQPGSELR